MALEMLTHPLVIIVASGTLIGIFLRGAAHKFLDFAWFAHTLSEYRILPIGFAVPAAGFLLAAEVAITLGLVVPESRFYAAGAAAVLLVLYGTAIAVNLLRGRTRIDCGCGVFGRSCVAVVEQLLKCWQGVVSERVRKYAATAIPHDR